MPITARFVIRSSIGLLGVAFCVLVFIVGANAWLGERARQHFDSVIAARELRTAATLLRESLLTAETSQRGFLLSGNEIYLAPLDNARLEVDASLERLRAILSLSPERAAMLGRLQTVVREKLAEIDTTIRLKTAGQEAEALSQVRTNRGKALMDEANVFITAVVLEAEERLTESVSEQRANAAWLRWTSILGGIVIILVVGGTIVTMARYTREIVAARDEVRRINETLEIRVKDRTAALSRARDRAEVLLAEVNHRVANSLTLVTSLIHLQMGTVEDPAAREALREIQGRIHAIAQLHKHLFTSSDVSHIPVDEYLTAVLAQTETAMIATGSGVRLNCSLERVELPADDCINLGIIITEWVTNAFKYAYGGRPGEVRVRLERKEAELEVTVEDDGVGRSDRQPVQGTGLGTRIVKIIAKSMAADVNYVTRNPGTSARLRLALGT
jgi:two-component sensor histidine kinase